MAEISRSDAINDLKDMIYKNNSDEVIEKAISDMEKLEKIEHILFDFDECKDIEVDTRMELCDEMKTDCNKCMIKRIEQILRGGE